MLIEDLHKLDKKYNGSIEKYFSFKAVYIYLEMLNENIDELEDQEISDKLDSLLDLIKNKWKDVCKKTSVKKC